MRSSSSIIWAYCARRLGRMGAHARQLSSGTDRASASPFAKGSVNELKRNPDSKRQSNNAHHRSRNRERVNGLKRARRGGFGPWERWHSRSCCHDGRMATQKGRGRDRQTGERTCLGRKCSIFTAPPSFAPSVSIAQLPLYSVNSRATK